MTTHANLSITISVGNAATQTPEDLADLINDAADIVRTLGLATIDHRSKRLMDYNGNPVGLVQVTGYYDEDENDD